MCKKHWKNAIFFSVIYDGTQPNPTTENVAAGLKLLKENNCDSVISP